MEKTLEIIFKDVYGGDGFVRYIDVEETKLDRTKKSKKTRDDMGVTVETAEYEVVTDKHKQEVQTFSYKDGVPILRLGGSHGKLWGALRGIALTLFHLGDEKLFKKSANPIMNMIQITPVWVPLEVLEPMKVQKLPQKLSGGGAQINMFYDVMPKAKCQVTIAYPSNIEKHVEKLLEQLPSVSLLNKRRASIEDMEEIAK